MANTRIKERELQQEITERVEGTFDDVEVLAVELSGSERFTVYVDSPAGVDHALCERVTDVLRDYLREYTVDVSSPGIERPLRRPAHFAQVVGRRVSLRTAQPVDGRSRFKGEVKAADDTELTVGVDGADFHIPYEQIVRGNLIEG